MSQSFVSYLPSDENIFYGIMIPAISLALGFVFYVRLYLRTKDYYTTRAAFQAGGTFVRLVFWGKNGWNGHALLLPQPFLALSCPIH
jgi:hypothetical protein